MTRSFTRRGSLLAFAAAAAFTAAAPLALAAEPDLGVLVMAHGGGAKWNGEVSTMLTPLRADYPLEIAFGMADAASLQEAVGRLEARGVRRIAVVRLFISGESWFERTQQILGLRAGARRGRRHRPILATTRTRATTWTCGGSTRSRPSPSAPRAWPRRRKWARCWSSARARSARTLPARAC